MSVSSVQHLRRDFNLLKFHTKCWLAGSYFTLLGKKKAKLDGVEVLVPYEVTDIRLRGQFQIKSYEKHERRYLKKYVHPESSILELGGCIGIVACVANSLLRHPKRHVVVEANPELVPYIERNKQHTGSAFAIENCMVSDQAENDFYIGPSIGESSARRKSLKKISVPGRTIAQLEQKHQLQFDTLIIDIEGAELDFFRENKTWLRRLNTVILETHPHPEMLSDEEVAECRNILEEAGLHLRVQAGPVWVLTRDV
ncbi:MAG: FkbM family methyltransferase [Lewinellaceae bacterium]|nr:FkbM family methyltransferase [Saprospiraceae bacterium]MCB9334148.1 FkbM family methyltransferase [Lewinellaceae bacterium]